ncbi:MAG: DUF4386 domain-containing protein [Tenericutes bacterium]|nr:DUF4386 domain-containing protein [Mycoplasmatota bacterium]
MKTYRMNSVMTGVLYFLGTVFGVASTIVGGKLLSSTVQTNPLDGIGLLDLIVTDSSKLLGGSFLILLMGISLVAMTVFLYPIFKKDSEELAMGMLLFRGALEGMYYFITAISFLILFAVGQEYVATGANATILQSFANVVYKFQDLLGPIGAILFLLGATCIYISFYRTKLIPRWLTIWGFVGVVPYMAYAILHLFGLDTGFGFYLQMVLAPQEIVMALWLIIKGFNKKAMNKLLTNNENS